MARPLRVCLDARILGGASGGVEQVIIGLVSGLSRVGGRDEEYLVLGYEGAAEWIRPHVKGNCRILCARSGPPGSGWKGALKRRVLAALPALSGLVRPALSRWGNQLPQAAPSDGTIEAAGVDVMHFTTQLGFLTKVPSIYQPHDLQHRHLRGNFDERAYQGRELLYRTLCEQARMVAVTSSWGKRDLIESYGLTEDKVQVIPWAPVLTEYLVPTAADLQAARTKFGVEDGFIFYPAQTWPHKNHIGLLEALVKVRERHGISARLVSSGRKNEYFPEIERAVRRLGLESQIRFTGFVTPLELQCLYRMAACVVIPTRFEAASFPLWEAFLAGVPAACSNVTSLPEQAGDAALVFGPDETDLICESIHRLLTDEELRRVLVTRGRANVAKFSWDATARRFQAHYRRLAGRALSGEELALMREAPAL